LTNERKQELLQKVQKMTPKERKDLKKVFDFVKKYKEYKEKEEEEEEKLRNLQSTDDTTDGEGTPLNTNGTSNPGAALQFLDFSGYNYDKSTGIINFKIFFYFIMAIPKKIWVPLIVHTNRLRSLADSEAEAECSPIDGTQTEKDSQGGVSQKFNCIANVPPGTEVSGVEVDTSKSIDIDDGSGRKPYKGEINLSKDASEQAQNLQDYTEEVDKVLMLQEGVLEGEGDKDGKFNINGNLIKIDDTNINLNLTNGSGEKVTVPCSISFGDSIGSDNYKTTLGCSVSEELENAEIHMRSGITDKKTKIVMNMIKGDSATITESPSSNTVNYRKSSSGLSGGAIAGIVIACVVVLIAAAVAAIMLRKPSTPPTDNTTVTNLNAVENI
jgi:hypothetical protein